MRNDNLLLHHCCTHFSVFLVPSESIPFRICAELYSTACDEQIIRVRPVHATSCQQIILQTRHYRRRAANSFANSPPSSQIPRHSAQASKTTDLSIALKTRKSSDSSRGQRPFLPSACSSALPRRNDA